MLKVKTYIDKSPIAGLGCFAAEVIPKGTVIWTFQDGFDTVIPKETYEGLPERAKRFILNFCYFDQKKQSCIMCMDNAKYFNHAIDPNCSHDGEDTIASRDIFPGEEITENYYTFDAWADSKLIWS
jgi:SET domain-containing protein